MVLGIFDNPHLVSDFASCVVSLLSKLDLFLFLDVVQNDLKSTLRILYSLFQKYRTSNNSRIYTFAV